MSGLPRFVARSGCAHRSDLRWRQLKARRVPAPAPDRETFCGTAPWASDELRDRATGRLTVRISDTASASWSPIPAADTCVVAEAAAGSIRLPFFTAGDRPARRGAVARKRSRAVAPFDCSPISPAGDGEFAASAAGVLLSGLRSFVRTAPRRLRPPNAGCGRQAQAQSEKSCGGRRPEIGRPAHAPLGCSTSITVATGTARRTASLTGECSSAQ